MTRRPRPITGSVYAERDRFVCEFRRHPALGRVRHAFDTAAEAKALKAHIEAYGAYPEAFLRGGSLGTGRTWNDALDALKAAGGPDGRWRTKGQDKSQVRLHEFIRGTALGATPVEQITYDVLEAFITKLATKSKGRSGRPKAPRTLAKYISAIGVVLTYASTKKGWLPRRPVMPKVAAEPHYQPTYSPTMLEGICNVLVGVGEPEAAFLCRVLYHSALRAGELLRLRTEDVEDECIRLLDPRKIKTKREGCRLVHIGRPAARELRAIIAAGKMPKYRRLHHLVTYAIRICGYEMVRPLHAFRHTAASSICGDDRMSLEDAQHLLGHSDPATTQLYRKNSEEFLRRRAMELSQRRGTIEVSAPASEIISFEKQRVR